MLNLLLYILFTFSSDNRGLQLACGETPDSLTQIGGSVVSSDYGPWGAEKKMFNPVLTHTDGLWQLRFDVHPSGDIYATCSSPDLLHWKPQDYHLSGSAVSASGADITSAIVNGKEQKGQLWQVDKSFIDMLRAHNDSVGADNARYSERMEGDKEHFRSLIEKGSLNATLTISDRSKTISDKMVGIFFEDISYAADGGLYGELIQNRDFEYSKDDKARIREWDHQYGWNNVGTISTENPLSENNPYHISLAGNGGKVIVQLVENGQVLAQQKLKLKSTEWKRYKATLTASANADKAELHIIYGNDTLKNYGWDGIRLDKGEKYNLSLYANTNTSHLNLDLISLFPQNTFKGHGLRSDLAQVIADMQPKFVRFPGGCMSHGDGIDNIYNWKETIGEWKDRKGAPNIWRYHQTRGLGFYEYFQFCEDIGAEPLPVLAAGVPCQNSGANAQGLAGQQGGIPLHQMGQYIQDILDLIDWANGDPQTSKWARMRADAGHPEPFHLKYIGIGNEDLISDVFTERYLMISKAIHEKYPDIQICGTAGPFHKGSSDYEWGWKIAAENKNLFSLIDEHYYESTGWFLNNQDYYDTYDRSLPKVYLGEYAASTNVKRSNIETALAEAIHLCNCERNGDIVAMTSYAPLLAKDGHNNWNPDLIYFNNRTVRLTPSYHTQRLFSLSSGDRYTYSSIATNAPQSTTNDISKRLVASVVTNTKNNKQYVKVVNALPVSVNLKLENTNGSFLCTTLAGEITDQKATIDHQRPMTNDQRPITLKPYSLTILEAKE